MRILLGVTGGIAAYKSPDLVRRLTERGADVQVVMTQSARRFVSPMTFQAVSGYVRTVTPTGYQFRESCASVRLVFNNKNLVHKKTILAKSVRAFRCKMFTISGIAEREMHAQGMLLVWTGRFPSASTPG